MAAMTAIEKGAGLRFLSSALMMTQTVQINVVIFFATEATLEVCIIQVFN